MENILDRIATETDLTKSERKVAATILKNPALVVKLWVVSISVT